MHTSNSYKMYSLMYCAGLCVVSFFGMWGAYHFFDYSKSGGEVMVSDGDEGNDDPACDVETKSEDSLRDPLLNEQKEKDDVTLNVKDDDDDFDLGFKPVELVFKDLKYTVKDKDGKDLVLIQNINGYATPGRLTALMGTTGAGKST